MVAPCMHCGVEVRRAVAGRKVQCRRVACLAARHVRGTCGRGCRVGQHDLTWHAKLAVEAQRVRDEALAAMTPRDRERAIAKWARDLAAESASLND